MFQLARWLLRHLDDPKLLIWMIRRGGHLHGQLIRLIENRLDELDKLESGGGTNELIVSERMRPTQSPAAQCERSGE